MPPPRRRPAAGALADVHVAGGRARATVRAERAAALCRGHFPGDPIVPGAYLAGLMAELAAAILPGTVLAEVERCAFRRRVTPRAPIALIARRIDATHVEAQVEVAGAVAASARLRYRVPA